MKFFHPLWLLPLLTIFHGCSQSLEPQSLIDSAIERHASGDYRTAMIELKNVLQDNPENAKARLELGRLYVSMEQAAFAEKELLSARELGIPARNIVIPLGESLLQQRDYKRLLKEVVSNPSIPEPQQVKILLLRGDAYLGLNEIEEAEKSFSEVFSLGPTNVDAFVGLAKVKIKEQDITAADKFISRALSSDPKSSSAWLVKGIIDRGRNDMAAAEQAFEKVIKIENEKPYAVSTLFLARLGLIQTQLIQKKNEEASKNIELMLKTSPAHPAPNYLKAMLAYQSGDLDTAAPLLQEILKVDKKNTSALMLLGAVKFSQGSLEQADMYLSTLLSIKSDDIAARKLLATTRMKLEQPEYALEALKLQNVSGEEDTGYLALSGAAYLKLGDYETGIDFLERAVESEPNSPGLQKDLILSYIKAGKLDSAVEYLEKTQSGKGKEGDYRKELMVIQILLLGKDIQRAHERAESLLEKRPDDPIINNISGGIMALMKRYDEASVYLDKAVKLSPNFEAAWMNLGRLAQVQGRYEAAAGYYKHILTINSTNSAAMFQLAQLSNAAGKQDEALEWLKKARSNDPQAIDARLVLARYFLVQKDYQQAHEIAVEASKIVPQSLETLNMLGVTQMQIKAYKDAMATFKLAVARSPDAEEIIFNLARAQLASNQITQSVENLQKALRLSPEHAPSAALLAILYARKGKSSEAIKLLSDQQEFNRDNPLLYVLEGDIRLSNNQFKDAALAYRKAWELAPDWTIAKNLYKALKGANMGDPMVYLSEWLETHPDDINILVIRAQAYQAKGDIRKAVEDYERALQIAPENSLILNNLAWLYYEMKDPRALSLAEKAHNISPELATIADTLGWLLVENGESARGLKILKKAVEQEPDSLEIHYHLAVAYAKVGDGDEAKKLMNQVIKADKKLLDFPYAKEILQNN